MYLDNIIEIHKEIEEDEKWETEREKNKKW